MNDLSKINLKSLIALSLIGYVFVLLIRYFEGIFSLVLQIVAIFLLRYCKFFYCYDKFFYFYDIIPRLVVVILWALLVFRYLDKFSGEINLSNDFSRRFAIRLIMFTLILFVIQTGLIFLSHYLMNIKSITLVNDYRLISTKSFILSFLGLVELIIILIGYFKIIKKSTAANMSS